MRNAHATPAFALLALSVWVPLAHGATSRISVSTGSAGANQFAQDGTTDVFARTHLAR